MPFGPNPNDLYPNPAVPSVCFIKNAITRPNILVGDYTYYDDVDGAERFEEHVGIRAIDKACTSAQTLARTICFLKST